MGICVDNISFHQNTVEMKRGLQLMKIASPKLPQSKRRKTHLDLTRSVQKIADQRRVILRRRSKLPKALQNSSNSVYDVVVTDELVYKFTNCSSLTHVKGLCSEFAISQKLYSIYDSAGYDLSDIVVPLSINLYTQSDYNGLLLYLVIPTKGRSVRGWLAEKQAPEMQAQVIKQLQNIHKRFMNIRFFHGDLKPANFLISNVTEGKGPTPKVSVCDFGLSSFNPTRRSFGGQGTHLFKPKSYFLHCDDWRVASWFQLSISLITISVNDALKTAWTCQRESCVLLHRVEEALSLFLNRSIADLLRELPIRRRVKKYCHHTVASREGKRSWDRRQAAQKRISDCANFYFLDEIMITKNNGQFCIVKKEL